jgi:segregation and condensation protein A
MLEMVQQRFFNILIGEGSNNFIIEWNEEGPQDLVSAYPVQLDPVLN